jgi:hypothetical protein
MHYRSITQLFFKWLLVASLLNFGLAMAQTEPTLNQVYATAQAGKLDQAQLMIQQVLISHPNSAKAFFVQSELYARQGDLNKARGALATAEKLAPALPFAKPDAVQALRSQLAAKNAPAVVGSPAAHAVATTPASAPPAPSSSWLLPLLLAGGVIGLGYFLFRKKKPDPFANQGGFNSASPVYSQPVYPNQGGMSGPQTFGMGGGVMQQPYGQPAASGLGGRIMGGVATGLAVGAGVMAAEAIGRNLMGNHNSPPVAGNNLSNNDWQAIDNNPGMGGQNFGVNDAGSWDDGAGSDVGGSGDWDN